ncbi:MFS transporter [Thermophagus xiamenensis]|uniref:Fucose permease n=1 Tax=Thermophagus xiamenensis TaxID=385682 RepID=A0A1I2F3T9_9BACT|nr:MFS transporter [Thermophagus xiamenensis]SFE99181.1 Fucose permease [Thermophagus xiamenensis]
MRKKSVHFLAAGMVMMLFGITMVAVGTINNYLTINFRVDKLFIGFCASVLAAGILIGSFTFGPIAERFGYKPVMLGGVLLVILGITGITFSVRVNLVPFMFFVMGLGGGSINGVTNMLVADLYPQNSSAYLSLLGVFYGIGALGFPLLTSLLLDKAMDYQTILLIVAIILLIPFILVLLLKFPSAKKSKPVSFKGYFKFFSNPVILSIGLFLFFYGALEAIIPAWTPTYLMEVADISYDKALYAITAIAIGITITRLFLSQILKRISPIIIIFGSMAVIFLGIIILNFASSLFMGISSSAVMGIGIAASFPVMLGFTARAFPYNSGTAFSIVIGISLVGNMLLNSLTGFILNQFGIKQLILILITFIILMLVILSFLKHRHFKN